MQLEFLSLAHDWVCENDDVTPFPDDIVDYKSTFYGVAIDTNIEFASINFVASAVNRAFGE